MLLGSAVGTQAAEVSANVTIASDYPFRGVSQTDRDPAIQGGFDVAFDSGFYIGTWASNVSFGITSMEWDLYLGYAGEINENVSYDLVYIRYEYPAAGSELDYNEIGASISFSDLTLGLMYSNEYFALDSVKWIYPYAEYSLGLPYDAALDFKVGLSIVDDNSAKDFEATFGDDQVLDWSVMYTVPLAGIDLSIGVVGTDISKKDCLGGDKACETRALVSISKSL
jgi:uncharacterized protein (TIGR02001 family)